MDSEDTQCTQPVEETVCSKELFIQQIARLKGLVQGAVDPLL